MEFSFTRTPKIIFGSGRIESLPKIAKSLGHSILLVTGAHSLNASGKLASLLNSLTAQSLSVVHKTVSGEPSPALIDEIVSETRSRSIEAVLAIGGGSVIDAGKAVSAMLPQMTSVNHYLEGIGTKTHDGRKVPFVAVPTTAGTGSEATKNAVLSHVRADGFKKSLRHDNFVPDIAVIDPELALSCPPSVTAACGMDAFTQLLEAYVSINASPLTDALAYSGIRHLKNSLIPAVIGSTNNLAARTGMAYASLMSGITLANAGLGIVHGLAGPIGGFFRIPHGAICGTLIGVATRINIQKLLVTKGYRDPALGKFAAIGKLIVEDQTLSIEAACQALTDKLDEWIDLLDLPRLGDFGVQANDIDRIVRETGNKNNPIILDETEIRQILSSRI
ncbi:iron-containing alcohol dehydrogenase [candidate division KSB1 bacterium]|nr:iron-containing alcohol dehydrogenase [candidate division KSB1 bacterium]